MREVYRWGGVAGGQRLTGTIDHPPHADPGVGRDAGGNGVGFNPGRRPATGSETMSVTHPSLVKFSLVVYTRGNRLAVESGNWMRPVQPSRI